MMNPLLFPFLFPRSLAHARCALAATALAPLALHHLASASTNLPSTNGASAPSDLASNAAPAPASLAWSTAFEHPFESGQPGDTPDGLFVLNGAFRLAADGTNRVLELPGEPLGNFGALMGPNRKTGVEILARVTGQARGRRLPSFAVSLGGQSGWRLRLAPNARALELHLGVETVATREFRWAPGPWTWLRLQIVPDGDASRVRGRAWPASDPEPDTWMFDEATDKTPNGKAGVWGEPFSQKPIWFDDIHIRTAD